MPPTQWAIDPTHSDIGFKVKHMMFTNVSGKFDGFEASAETEEENFEGAKISFSADASSVNTGNADRDKHLASGDFFDAAQFPKLSFQSTAFKKVNDDNYELHGDLSLHGITKNVQLAVEYGGIGKDPWGNTKAGFSVSGKFNRKDFGLSWNAALETGGVLVSEEVRVYAEIQLVKQA
ncbi:MAG: YceI family protein [Chitinophagaceae bacterium]|nr:YceI family protein [Chitinophagaceae bacterium]